MSLTLIIGSKKTSTWSLRAWLILKYFKIPFKEVVLDTYKKNFIKKILKYSPTKKVPCLIDKKNKIWDSLAIGEYLAEKYYKKKLWPTNLKKRTLARCISAEIHSGFFNLRENLSMKNFSGKNSKYKKNKNTINEIKRAQFIIDSCLKKSKGPFLFGKFSIADCMWIPVMFRFKIYNVKVSLNCKKYLNSILMMPEIQEWLIDGLNE
jgi:glutathione S-transferase